MDAWVVDVTVEEEMAEGREVVMVEAVMAVAMVEVKMVVAMVEEMVVVMEAVMVVVMVAEVCQAM